MINILVSFLPIVLFLLALIYLDSFKLVKSGLVALAILSGNLAAVIAFFINSALVENTSIDLANYIKYIAPIIEEFFKVFIIIYLLLKHKIGFMVDAAIYGFAAGAGFAVVENIYYLNTVTDSGLFLWIIRGFGTAVMHGGTTAVFSIITKGFIDRYKRFHAYYIIPGFLSVVIIHSLFNHLLFSPVLMTMLQLIILPIILITVFHKSEMKLKQWMETGMDNDVRLLEQINSGKISDTHVGEYLISLQNNFSGNIIGDMLCYIKLNLELAVKAKGVLLMKEAGLQVLIDNEVKEKFEEIRYLERSIGSTGRLAVTPVLHNSTHDLWQLYMLQ